MQGCVNENQNNPTALCSCLFVCCLFLLQLGIFIWVMFVAHVRGVFLVTSEPTEIV
jgi:hypothetical protein